MARRKRFLDDGDSDSENSDDRRYATRLKKTKVPEFVMSNKPVNLDAVNSYEDGDEKDAEYSDYSETSRPPSPSRTTNLEESTMSSIVSGSTPSSFGRKTFARSSNASPTPVALPASELAHFSKIQGSFGARMLAKMGWQAGTGLGTTGDGIVIPIETKVRPQKMGIAFKGFKEKTEQSKLEAKRRGEIVSDEEDEKVKKLKEKSKEMLQKRSDVWKRPKKVKTKIEHKTYEQIISEVGEVVPSVGIGQIIDATGAVPREVSSLADISLNTWSPSNDPTRIPEVRHNVRLIADACKHDIDNLASEAKALQERRKFVTEEDSRLRQKVAEEAELIAKLHLIQVIANDLSVISRELPSSGLTLEPFVHPIEQLSEYSSEYDKFCLDEIVVAAIAPVVRKMVADWNPLEEPTLFLSIFRSWRVALKVKISEINSVDINGSNNEPATLKSNQPMTPFESLLWDVWLPKVRSSINNEWSPEEPDKLVKLYDMWSTFLPQFICDNLLDQLILPKVQKMVAEWHAKKSKVSLQKLLFPWLPYVGSRMEELIGDARRKIKNLLRSWVVGDPIPTELEAWKDVIDLREWDTMLMKYVVPKLGETMRNDFHVNPRDQDLTSLHRVLAWSRIIRSSIFAQIIERGFFPKWLDTLHFWLIQPQVSSGQVAKWYSEWKDVFPEEIRDLPGINRGFTRGLQLMNKALEYGPDAPTKLAKPDFIDEISVPSLPAHSSKEAGKAFKPSARNHEITFRSIVEDFAALHNLLFIPTGKTHERSRMPLYRVNKTADSRKGLLVYVLDDAVWAPKVEGPNVEGEEFKAISLEDMVTRV